MRLIIAGLFVYISMMMTVGWIDSLYPDEEWPWWTSILGIAVMFGTIILSLFIFNRSGERPTFKSTEQIINELREKGKLVSETHKAMRWFQAEEFEDEGSHYFIELENSQVLYLNGQYLYEYEPYEEHETEDDNEPRRFPCMEFILHKDADTGYIIDIECNGEVLEPEVVTPAFTYKVPLDFKKIPYDGDIISEYSYSELKNALLNPVT